MKRNTSRFLILAMIGTILYGVDSTELVQVKAENGRVVESQIVEKEFVIQDSSFNLDTIVEKELKDANVIKLSNSNVAVGKVILPKQVTHFLGWKAKNILDPVEEEMVRYLGSKVTNQTFSFEMGSQTKVRNIHFEQGVLIQIPENVTVIFENCTFQGKVENKGNSSFVDCTFVTNEMINTGKTEFLGTTKVPNTVTFDQNNPFTLEVEKERMADGIKNVPYQDKIIYKILGMKEEEVQLSVSMNPNDMGVTATVENGVLMVSGTPKEAGTIQITLIGKAKVGSEEVIKQILLVVQGNITNVETGSVPSNPVGSDINSTGSTNNSTSSSSSSNNGGSNVISGGNTVITSPSSGSSTQTDAVSSATSNAHNTTNGSTNSTTQNSSTKPTSNESISSNASSGGNIVITSSSSGSSTQTDAVSSATSNAHKTEQNTSSKKKEGRNDEKNSSKKIGKKEKAQNKQLNEKKSVYYKKISGSSFLKVLKSLKVDVSFDNRKKIAEANGIKNYTGTESQNAKLLELAQKGKLRQPKTEKTKKKLTKTKNIKKSTKSIQSKKN